MAPATPVKATLAVPFVYRLLITTIEPLLAVGGALLAFTAPENYLVTMTRGSQAFHEPSTFLYTELGGAWLYFAFNEAILLRLYDDARFWRIICFGMLLSDIPYCHSGAQAVGGWTAWATLAEWTREDWIVFWTTAPMVLTRILIVLGVGLKTPTTTAGKKSS